MNATDQSKVLRFHKLLFAWYKKHQRQLPWRKTHDPYKILVSEVMLQQTQVPRVIPKYLELLDHYPTAHALDRAKMADVLRLWSGLGYNRRAVYLKRAAEMVVRDRQGEWPRTIGELQQLPGVGHYTAAAILSFAFNQDVPLADVNMERVIGRIFIGPSWSQLPKKRILEIIEQVLPKGKSRIFPHAVMDLGAALARRDPSLERWQKEFPELFVADHKKPTKREVWLGSNRQLRGAILRRVQQGTRSIEMLAHDLSLPPRRLKKLIESLTKDGLIRYGGEGVSLP